MARPRSSRQLRVARVLPYCWFGPVTRTTKLNFRTSDMKHADSTTNRSSHATERRMKLRLRDLCDEVLASYHQARGQDLFSSDDRKIARDLMTSIVGSR